MGGLIGYTEQCAISRKSLIKAVYWLDLSFFMSNRLVLFFEYMSYRICRPTPPILWFCPRAYNRRSTAYWPHWRLTSRRVLRHPQLRKYHYPQPLSWPSNDCYSLVQVLKDISVVRLCSLRPRAESVTYLLYRYSVVKYQRGIFCSSPIPMKSGF